MSSEEYSNYMPYPLGVILSAGLHGLNNEECYIMCPGYDYVDNSQRRV